MVSRRFRLCQEGVTRCQEGLYCVRKVSQGVKKVYIVSGSCHEVSIRFRLCQEGVTRCQECLDCVKKVSQGVKKV